MKHNIKHVLLVKNDKDFLNILLNDHLSFSYENQLIPQMHPSQFLLGVQPFHCILNMLTEQSLCLILFNHCCENIMIDLHVLLQMIANQWKLKKQFRLEAEQELSQNYERVQSNDFILLDSITEIKAQWYFWLKFFIFIIISLLILLISLQSLLLWGSWSLLQLQNSLWISFTEDHDHGVKHGTDHHSILHLWWRGCNCQSFRFLTCMRN